MSLEYDEDRRGLFLVELDDVAREISYLEGGATLLQLVAPEGMTLLDLSEGWALVEAPTALPTVPASVTASMLCAPLALRGSCSGGS